MKRRRIPQVPTEYEPTAGEFAAAGMLGLIALAISHFLTLWWRSGNVDLAALTIVALFGGIFVWIGGRGLRRARTWTVAAKIFGACAILIGLTTAFTGYRPETRYKIWRKVDRDADLPFIVVGLLIVGFAFLFDSWCKSRERTAEQARGEQRR